MCPFNLLGGYFYFMAEFILTAGIFFMTILESCEQIKGSSPKKARKLAMKLVSSAVIEDNEFDIEAIKKGLGICYYNHILLELSNTFHIGKKK